MTLESIVAQIRKNKLDLRPNFQRGEVWAERKQKCLIDSILRQWYVPPIHVVRSGSALEVLDGQQRLRAIYEFANDSFPVDASIDPESRQLRDIDGHFYSELPTAHRRNFDRFKVTVFTLEDYKPAEPGELFFRLNQPATLTTAEQRNAFFGTARDQVKRWVSSLHNLGIDKDVIGFSNNRMAYDDTLARAALSIEFKTLHRKITANDLVEMYRSPRGYAASTVRRMDRAISVFDSGKGYFAGLVRFNKATLYSWLIFLVRANEHLDSKNSSDLADLFGQYVCSFNESLLLAHSGSRSQRSLWETSEDRKLLHFFYDRATSRVADVSSVVLRDFIIWFYLRQYLDRADVQRAAVLKRNLHRPLSLAELIYSKSSESLTEESLEREMGDKEWGAFL